MKKITRVELVDILKKINHAMPINLLTAVEPRMRKTNNIFYGRIKKLQMNNVFIGVCYQNSVNRVREKEGMPADFKASPRKWGNRIPNTPMVEHNGNLYLECRFLSSTGTPTYLLDNNKPITKEELGDWLVNPKSNASHQGITNEVILRDYNINSIVEIHMDNEKYVVV